MKKKFDLFQFDEVTLNMAAFNDYTMHIVFTNNIIRAEDYICTRDNLDKCTPSRDAHALHVKMDDQWVSYVIFPRDANAGTLAHECWHVIYNMLNKMGAAVENEIVAYLLGYIVNKSQEFQIKLREGQNDPRGKRQIAGKRGNRRRRKHNSTTKVRTTTKVRGGAARARQAN